MRRITILCLAVIFGTTTVWGQDEERQFLFPEFQNGRAVFKDGTTATARLNYSLLTNLFVFMDSSDGDRIKEIANVPEIGNIVIGSRVFHLSSKGEAIETVQAENPVVFAKYIGKLTDRGRKSAYGGRTQTSAVQSISSIESGGMTYKLEGDDRWIVTGVDKEYQVEREGRMRTFFTTKQFLKIYPKQNVAAIEAYIAENGVDLDSVEQAIELCNYAQSLD